MRAIIGFLLLCACGGPSAQQVTETPSATVKPRPREAPPASTSDRERAQMTQSFDDMETTQNAYREAGQADNQKKNQKAQDVKQQQQKPKAPVEQAPPGVPPPKP